MTGNALPFLIDSHCHLDFDAFNADRNQVMDEAEKAGVIAIIDPGINLESSRKVIELAQSMPGLFAAIGVHPNEAVHWNMDTLNALEFEAINEKVVAIGEIGLDYYRDSASRAVQISIFEKQLQLAAKLYLPVIIHNREAGSDIIAILSAWVKGVS
jgi:TatD DNase family protein